MIGLVLILVLSLGLIAWGSYLNVSGENTIAARMDNRRLALTGARAGLRELAPKITIDEAKLTSKEMADAVALVDGRITATLVNVNDKVSYGTALFTLTNDDLPLKLKQADSAILRAEAELTRAQNSYNRYSRLIGYNATSREKLDEAEASYRAALATRDAAITEREQVEVQMGRQTVTAPLAGSVILTYRNTGSYVTAGTALALIGNYDTLYFTVSLPAAEAQTLAVGSTLDLLVHETGVSASGASAHSESGGDAGEMEQLTATVERITPTLAEAAPRYEVEVRIENPGLKLKPQTYRHIHLQVPREVRCLAVPVAAMLDSRRDSLFVVDAAGRLTRREVVAGITDGRYIEIVSGLEAGDVVVTSSTDGLEEGMVADITLEDE